MENLFFEVINLLKLASTDPSLTEDQKNVLLETIARLNAISNKCIVVIEQNDNLLENNSASKEIRNFFTDEKINEIMLEQSKKDPALASFLTSTGRLVKQNSTEIAAFDMSRTDNIVGIEVKILKELQLETEALYQSLWVIKGRLGQIPKFSGFNPPGVRDVRNHLIEHTDKEGSKASIYSFGIATNGPVLRPIKPYGANAPHDLGFKINLEEFLNFIIRKI